jgi:hypothetical protein
LAQEVHARRADEVPDEGVRGPLEQGIGRAHLHGPAARHHHHLSAKVSASTWSWVT